MTAPTTATPQDIVTAAMSVARDAAEGRLDPVDLERQALAELTELVDIDAEPDSPLAALQLAVARRVLARGGVDPDELAEWLSVARSRSGGGNPPSAP